MNTIRAIKLSPDQRESLKKGYRYGKTYRFRQRCQIVLLKAQGLSDKQIGQQVELSRPMVNKWLQRWREQGIEGLQTRKGRGRPRILHEEQDAALVRQAVQENRQRLSQAKIKIEQQLDKEFSLKTLKRFLKNLTQDINASESGPKESR